MTIHPQQHDLPSSAYGPEKDLIPKLATLIRSIDALQHRSTTQFYVWSTVEQSLLQSHIVNSALSSSANIDDVRVCIGTLAQGASLLQTTFQPLVLSGALLAFLGKGKRTKAEYKACLERMELPTEGTMEVLRKRIDNEIRRLQNQPTPGGTEDRQKELGQLQRVVILKREIERQLALPIAGYWDLPECASILLSYATDCPDDEQIFMAYKKVASDESLVHLLARRNQCIYTILQDLRTRTVSPAGHSLLVNEGRELSMRFLDVCAEPHLRKLFFMQQVRNTHVPILIHISFHKHISLKCWQSLQTYGNLESTAALKRQYFNIAGQDPVMEGRPMNFACCLGQLKSSRLISIGLSMTSYWSWMRQIHWKIATTTFLLKPYLMTWACQT